MGQSAMTTELSPAAKPFDEGLLVRNIHSGRIGAKFSTRLFQPALSGSVMHPRLVDWPRCVITPAPAVSPPATRLLTPQHILCILVMGNRVMLAFRTKVNAGRFHDQRMTTLTP